MMTLTTNRTTSSNFSFPCIVFVGTLWISYTILITFGQHILVKIQFQPSLHEESSIFSRFTNRTRTQLANYRNGHGIVINLHLTHHAGTTFCALAMENGPCPPIACNPLSNESSLYKYGDHNFSTWNWNEPPYHMIGWEFGAYVPSLNFNAIHWEHDHIISIFIAREPLSRLLKPGPMFYESIGRPELSNQDSTATWNRTLWLQYLDYWKVNNFVLTVLTQDSAEKKLNGLVAAKELLNRFTFILDAECLDDNLSALSRLLGWKRTTASSPFGNITALHHLHIGSVRERIHNDEVFENLKERNEYDIALYRWLKTKSLIRCKDY